MSKKVRYHVWQLELLIKWHFSSLLTVISPPHVHPSLTIPLASRFWPWVGSHSCHIKTSFLPLYLNEFSPHRVRSAVYQHPSSRGGWSHGFLPSFINEIILHRCNPFYAFFSLLWIMKLVRYFGLIFCLSLTPNIFTAIWSWTIFYWTQTAIWRWLISVYAKKVWVPLIAHQLSVAHRNS